MNNKLAEIVQDCENLGNEPEGVDGAIKEYIDMFNSLVKRLCMRNDKHTQEILQLKAQVQNIEQQLIGDKEHPENWCHLCGGKNINWYADNDLWNEVIPSDMKPSSQIICPICFVKLAEKKGIILTAWRLSKEGDAPKG